MSKFIDKLEKVGLQLPTPLGFGTASKREEQPPAIMLVGCSSGLSRCDRSISPKIKPAYPH